VPARLLELLHDPLTVALQHTTGRTPFSWPIALPAQLSMTVCTVWISPSRTRAMSMPVAAGSPPLWAELPAEHAQGPGAHVEPAPGREHEPRCGVQQGLGLGTQRRPAGDRLLGVVEDDVLGVGARDRLGPASRVPLTEDLEQVPLRTASVLVT
jgi:hypothetical protein